VSLYGLHNLPYGVFSVGGGRRRIGVRVHDQVLDLDDAEAADLVLAGGALRRPVLNDFLALGRTHWSAVRARIAELVEAGDGTMVPLADVELHLPWAVGDYVDFYSSEHHAANVGRILRPGQPPVLPNWRHLPIGYHGRAGTVVVSGTPITRPSGQRPGPTFGPTEKLDIEAEVGFVVGVPSALGEPVPAGRFRDHVFGVVLVNDWSARDIQAFEYQPLGPFLGKSFATSVAPWIVPLDALDASWVPAPPQDPPVQPYLADDRRALDLSLTVDWNATRVSSPPFSTMYWTPAQQLAHMTVNGASVRTGDLYASGTVSGPEPDQVGSFLERTADGPITLADGTERRFLLDGDTVTISATAPGPDGTSIGFGEVSGTIGTHKG
jgi:fumarylacetoacetase